MILLWGLEADHPLSAVRRQLSQMGSDVVFADQRAVLQSRLEGDRLEIAGRVVRLSEISAAYLRPYESARLAAVRNGGSAAALHAAAFDEELWDWAETADATVVNRPSSMVYNSSKPDQLRRLVSAGFNVPDTLVTTDPTAVSDFRAQHGDIIYKSISAVRSVVVKLTRADLDRLSDITNCPTQFQAHIPGVDHRIHVVGEEVYGCRIVSSATDYRYASRSGTPVTLQSEEVDEVMAERCRRVAQADGLLLAGIDLRLTPEKVWYCFEMNPSPAFTYYDSNHEAIAHAVARLLASSTTASRSV